MVVGAAIVAVWLVVVFAGIVSRADELDAAADRERQTRDTLIIQSELVDDEIDFVRSDAFVQQAARAHGYGTADEQHFRLPEDAGTPPPIRPLGEP